MDWVGAADAPTHRQNRVTGKHVTVVEVEWVRGETVALVELGLVGEGRHGRC